MQRDETASAGEDGSPQEPLAELRGAVGRFVRAPADEDELRMAVRRLARSARRQGMQAEELIIALKNFWHGHPAVAAIPERSMQHRLLARLVTLAIEAYYTER